MAGPLLPIRLRGSGRGPSGPIPDYQLQVERGQQLVEALHVRPSGTVFEGGYGRLLESGFSTGIRLGPAVPSPAVFQDLAELFGGSCCVFH